MSPGSRGGWDLWEPGDPIVPEEWPVACVGPGRVGSGLCRALRAAGFPIVLVGGGDGASARALADELEASAIAPPYDGLGALARLVVVTPPDHALGEVASILAAGGTLRPGMALLHCSATEPASALGGDAPRPDVYYLSMHPLRPFPDAQRGLEHFRDVLLAIEGEDPARDLGHRLARILNGKAVDLEPEAKTLYHAVGVLSATGSMALAQAAAELAAHIGLDEGFVAEGILPLMRGALDAVEVYGLPEGLTGPIGRGDAEVVARHIEALREHAPDLLPLYLEVARRNLVMAEEKGALTPERLQRIRDLL